MTAWIYTPQSADSITFTAPLWLLLRQSGAVFLYGFYAFCPRSGGFFVSGRQRFLKTQPNCKKSYNFLIKKGGFPLTALL